MGRLVEDAAPLSYLGFDLVAVFSGVQAL